MKIWLDDERDAPDDSWTVVRTAEECLELLESGVPIEEISLDHDLGEGRKTGYDVACRIEEMSWTKSIPPLKWSVHSQNPVGRDRIAVAMTLASKWMERP